LNEGTILRLSFIYLFIFKCLVQTQVTVISKCILLAALVLSAFNLLQTEQLPCLFDCSESLIGEFDLQYCNWDLDLLRCGRLATGTFS